MADRKVLVKYYPPDFDFDKLQAKKKALRIQQQQQKRRRGDVFDPPQKRHKNKIMNVRMMFPFTLKCGTCSEFIYVGTKFNSRVEKVEGEDYLGIIKWRFYGRCPHCRAEVCFKTDPQNCDYVLEWGGTRMCDPLRDQALAAERVQKEEEEKLATDRVSQVEASRQGLQQEILALEQLAELRRLNRRLLDKTAASDAALAFLKERRINGEDGDQEGGQEWNEEEKDELKFFRAAREFDSDPQSSEEELVGGGEPMAALDSTGAGGNSTSNSSSSRGGDASTSSSSSSSSSSNTEAGEGGGRRPSTSSASTSTSSSCGSNRRSEADDAAVCGASTPHGAKLHEASSKQVLNFGLGVCVAAPKLVVVRKPQPQPSGDCSALLGEYGSPSSEEADEAS
ncbi:YJU2 splicing factor homolog [Cyclospora cayetanensis]|uniref:Splicing factor YJU2 n=1 Tax=Cyclospora cayetanensis TaxID=88456 RepID=A0A6P6RZ47_9EIME|nr:YJU2 splicing factor homolog [Cyclospora cayetanensis]